MALTKVQAGGLNLADTFAFTGTVTGVGKTLAVTKFTSSTRTVLPAQTSYDFFSTNVTQVKANSKFLVHVQLIGWVDYSGIQEYNLTYDGTVHKGQAAFTFSAQDYMHSMTGLYYIDGASSTGAKNFKFSWDHTNSGSGKPFNVWNPDSNDDARYSGSYSNIIFIEYDL